MKYSIVIPTITKELVTKCVNSILKYTTINDDMEIIVVANGGDTKDLTLPDPIKILYYPEPLGAVKAYNEGIKKAQGDYIILLNDDTEIMNSPIDNWINRLLDPLINNEKTVITGVYKMIPPRIGNITLNFPPERMAYGFILFFCAAIKKSFFNEVGLLDESLKCGVDIDLCMKAMDLKYEILQVSDPSKMSYAEGKYIVLDFPLFHEPESTIFKHYGKKNWDDIIKHDCDVLNERYGIKDPWPQGWFGNDDITSYRQMIELIPDYGNMLEIGSWKGRSLCSVADIIKRKNINLYIIDTFEGTQSNQWEKTLHSEAKMVDLRDVLINNLNKFGLYNFNIIKGNSQDLSIINKFEDEYFDFIFIDGDHLGLSEDIENWYSKVKKGAAIAGHDLTWSTVMKSLNDKFGENYKKWSVNMWYKKKEIGRVFDCFMFHNELDLLEIRFKILDPIVDVFVISESKTTHSGKPKPLYFELNKDRFKKWDNKIRYVIHDEKYNDPWLAERKQRDAIKLAWDDATDNDIMIITDMDEIPNPFSISEYIKNPVGIKTLEMDLYYCTLENKAKGKWVSAKILPYSIAKNMTPTDIRYTDTEINIKDAGWHLSYFYDINGIIDKFESYAHTENNNEHIKNPERILKSIQEGTDIIDRGPEFTNIKVNPLNENIHPVLLNKFYGEQTKIIDTYEIYKNEMPSDDIKNIMPDFIKPMLKGFGLNEKPGVTAYVSTKDRYNVLPFVISGVINQSYKPNEFIIFDDGEKRDLREDPIFSHLFKMLELSGIQWHVIFGEGKGQVLNHQKVLSIAKNDLIWRTDDDNYPEYNVLETLVNKIISDDKIGAVASLSLIPDNIVDVNNASSNIDDLYTKPNIQWSRFNGWKEVHHLHNSFLFRKEASKHGYHMGLSPVGHREETMFSYGMYLEGWKLYVCGDVITWHLRQSTGGIRSYTAKEYYDNDEKIFRMWMEEHGKKLNDDYFFACLDNGLGDHLDFFQLLPDIRKKYKNITLAVCYHEVFEDEKDIELISISDAFHRYGNLERFNIYKYMVDNNWKDSIVEAYRKLYELE